MTRLSSSHLRMKERATWRAFAIQEYLSAPQMIGLVLALLAAAGDTSSFAQVPAAIYSGRERHLAVAPPRIDATARIDGSLDEAPWRQAAALNGFSQYAPVDGRVADDSTEVLVWYSPTAIYFGVRAFAAPGTVHATLADRDRMFSDDYVGISA